MGTQAPLQHGSSPAPRHLGKGWQPCLPCWGALPSSSRWPACLLVNRQPVPACVQGRNWAGALCTPLKQTTRHVPSTKASAPTASSAGRPSRSTSSSSASVFPAFSVQSPCWKGSRCGFNLHLPGELMMLSTFSYIYQPFEFPLL